MNTKYARQIASARKTIVKKGTTVTWSKTDNTNTSDDDAPEFPTEDTATLYPNTPIVFYPSSRQSLATILASLATGGFTDNLQGIIPGDVPFQPAIDDAVQMIAANGSTFTLHVSSVNTTQPDLAPIVYEVVFK